MVTIAEFTVEAEDFPLGSVFKQLPGAEVELERIVPTSHALIPYFWLRGAVSEDVVAAFGNRPGVENMELVDKVDNEYLLRVEWQHDVEGILEAVTNTEVSLMSAIGTNEEWRFEVRAEEASSISTFQRKCREYDVPVELVGLHALTPMRSGAEYDLTESQREALVLAFGRGYYQSPQEATLEEIAEELGITGQALGSRLRRGTHRLIASTLISPSSEE